MSVIPFVERPHGIAVFQIQLWKTLQGLTLTSGIPPALFSRAVSAEPWWSPEFFLLINRETGSLDSLVAEIVREADQIKKERAVPRVIKRFSMIDQSEQH